MTRFNLKLNNNTSDVWQISKNLFPNVTSIYNYKLHFYEVINNIIMHAIIFMLGQTLIMLNICNGFVMLSIRIRSFKVQWL
jgi:uncharacterized membrane protein (UPF0182 family)